MTPEDIRDHALTVLTRAQLANTSDHTDAAHAALKALTDAGLLPDSLEHGTRCLIAGDCCDPNEPCTWSADETLIRRPGEEGPRFWRYVGEWHRVTALTSDQGDPVRVQLTPEQAAANRAQARRILNPQETPNAEQEEAS